MALQVMPEEHRENDECHRPEHQADHGGQRLLLIRQPSLLVTHQRRV
jgi:hypothetical protein